MNAKEKKTVSASLTIAFLLFYWIPNNALHNGVNGCCAKLLHCKLSLQLFVLLTANVHFQHSAELVKLLSASNVNYTLQVTSAISSLHDIHFSSLTRADPCAVFVNLSTSLLIFILWRLKSHLTKASAFPCVHIRKQCGQICDGFFLLHKIIRSWQLKQCLWTAACVSRC